MTGTRCFMAYTILVVDDSSIIREVLERILHMTKLPIDSVLNAQHGKEALEILRNHWVDIVFTDINMPEMSGIELIEVMKKESELMDVPVVVISTEGSKRRIAELEAMGIAGYIRKPFKPESIRDTIIKTLGAWE